MLRAWIAFVLVAAFVASTIGSNREKAAMAAPADTIAVVSERPDASIASLDQPGRGLTLRRQGDGHFYADTMINGAKIHMLVDTGATGIALSRDDARRAGIGVSSGMTQVVGRGAGGDVHGKYVTLDRVSLGGKRAENMPAVVLDGGEKSLLGQAFLARFASVEIKDDRMVLR